MVAICGSRELNTQIISEVEVEKMAIKVDVQMRVCVRNTCSHCISSCRRTKELSFGLCLGGIAHRTPEIEREEDAL